MERRLDILKESGVISEKSKNIAFEIYKKHFYIFEDSDILDSFITHVAIAAERNLKGDIINDLDKDILNELKRDESYKVVKDKWTEIEKDLPFKFSQNEKNYIFLHLVNILR